MIERPFKQDLRKRLSERRFLGGALCSIRMPFKCVGAEVSQRVRFSLRVILRGHGVTVVTLTWQLTAPHPASVSPPKAGIIVVPTQVSCDDLTHIYRVVPGTGPGATRALCTSY